MNRQQHEGIGGSGLSSAILPWVEQPERLHELRQFLSEYTHRCRNSLHGIKMSLYLFRRGIPEPPSDAWTRLERAYQDTERLFDRLQEIYRPMRTTMVRSPLGRLLCERLPVWCSWFAERGITLRADPPAEEVLGEYDPMHLSSRLTPSLPGGSRLAQAAGMPESRGESRRGISRLSGTKLMATYRESLIPRTTCGRRGQKNHVHATRWPCRYLRVSFRRTEVA